MAFHKYLGDSKMFEYDKHYRECQQQNRPFIKARVNPLHNNYFIQMDMMTCNYQLSKNDQGVLEKLIRDEIEYVKSNSKYDFQGFSIDKELVWVDGVSSEHVDSFCISLYDLKNLN
ncbi:MAG: hypothetical protein KJN83_02180 [Nitrosopumilus sp.]|nr:hypothetical protein [Nitrosopumilus sp.]